MIRIHAAEETSRQDGISGDPCPPLRTLSVLMPVYNERWTLRSIVPRVLAAPVPLEIELIIVDDGSTDGSWELIQELAAGEPRIKALRHPRNRGKGAAVRTAIEHVRGEVAVVQDADLEYDPQEYRLLLEPILEGKADAVFGSRFSGPARRVLFFWHSLANRLLTLAANAANDLNLSDMETCYKMVRSDVLRRLRLRSETFTIEPELTCRLAQWGARMYEVPISYFGRTYEDGKKIRARDGLRALWEIFRCRVLDPQFTDHAGFYTLTSTARSNRYNQWLFDAVQPWLGQRVLEAGAGIGNLSGLLQNRQRLVLADYESIYLPVLRRRFGHRSNVRIDLADLTRSADVAQWRSERLDTVFCSNVLEHLEADRDVLAGFYDLLEPAGHCIIVVPAGRRLYTPLDKELGHCRRYEEDELREKMTAAGFEVLHTKRFNRVGTLSWATSGLLFRNRHLSPAQMVWFDRLLPVIKLLERVLPVPGMSLIAVGRKPQLAAQRLAA